MEGPISALPIHESNTSNLSNTNTQVILSSSTSSLTGNTSPGSGRRLTSTQRPSNYNTTAVNTSLHGALLAASLSGNGPLSTMSKNSPIGSSPVSSGGDSSRKYSINALWSMGLEHDAEIDDELTKGEQNMSLLWSWQTVSRLECSRSTSATVGRWGRQVRLCSFTILRLRGVVTLRVSKLRLMHIYV